MISSFALMLLGGVTVTLPGEAQITGTEITLGQVAEVTGDDPAEVERVRAASLGYAPAPGYSRVLLAPRIAARLSRELGLELGLELRVEGAERCVVTPLSHRVTAQELRAKAASALNALLEGVDAHVEPSGTLVGIEVPEAREAVELRSSPRRPRALSGAWSVPVEILLDGELYRTVWTSWKVELWERRQVLRNAVRAGQFLQPDDFITRRMRVGSGAERYAIDAASLGQAVMLRDLPAGAVVSDRDVRRMMVMKRGDVIGLEVRRGTVTVRTQAIAQQDGRVGDRIRVMCERTGKEVTALVVTRGLVELRLK